MKKILFLASAVLLVCACSLGASGTAAPSKTGATRTPTVTLTPTPSPAQILARSADALLALDSARFRIEREGEPVVFDETTGMAFISSDGEYQAPDRVHAKVKVNLYGNVLEIEMYWLPEGVFISNPLTHGFLNAPADLGIDAAALFSADGLPAVLKNGIEDPQLAGRETIEDVETIHITGRADGAVLAPLTAGALEGGTLYPVDIWVAAADYTPVRVRVTEPDGSGWLVDLYDFNADITVALPG